MFGPFIFTFLVANTNVAAELLIRGKFMANSISFIMVPSFCKAISVAPPSDPEELDVANSQDLNQSKLKETNHFPVFHSRFPATTSPIPKLCHSSMGSTQKISHTPTS
jgi:hypothetical protein